MTGSFVPFCQLVIYLRNLSLCRWFSRVVIEGASPKTVSESDEESSSSDEGEHDDDVKLGETYRVGGGKVKRMEGGMGQYVGIVERGLAKRAKAV